MNIAIASGKGGTGKTSVSVNLALSIPGPVQVLDCDADEPNVHTLLPLKTEEIEPVFTMIPEFDEVKCTQSKKCAAFCPNHAIFVGKTGIQFFPELCYGCGGCILSCPNQSIKEGKRQLGVIVGVFTPKELTLLGFGARRFDEGVQRSSRQQCKDQYPNSHGCDPPIQTRSIPQPLPSHQSRSSGKEVKQDEANWETLILHMKNQAVWTKKRGTFA